jgi:hypothetical protein
MWKTTAYVAVTGMSGTKGGCEILRAAKLSGFDLNASGERCN